MNTKNRTETEYLSAVVLGSLDDEGGAGSLARRAYRSRSQFYRLFQALVEESPGNMRRRLLLERAAWQLGRTQFSVTPIGLDANYGSLEAFTRAFRKAFHISLSLYRRMGATHTHLPAPNGFHFCARVPARKELSKIWTSSIFSPGSSPGIPAACWNSPRVLATNSWIVL